MSEWMDYFPDFMSPLGMIFYSFIVYIIVIIHGIIRKRTVEKYVDKSLRDSIQNSVLENRKKRSEQAEKLLKGIQFKGNWIFINSHVAYVAVDQ